MSFSEVTMLLNSQPLSLWKYVLSNLVYTVIRYTRTQQKHVLQLYLKKEMHLGMGLYCVSANLTHFPKCRLHTNQNVVRIQIGGNLID